MVGRLESRVQVDAGVDDESAVHAVLAAGAEWVVIGARAADDPAWLADQSSLAPGRLLYSLDLRGWEVPGLQSRARQSRHPLELVADLESMELAGVLILAESRAGRSLDGSLDLVEDIVAASPWPVAVAGGVRGLRDLRALELRGVAAAVIEPKRLDDAPELCWLAEEFAA